MLQPALFGGLFIGVLSALPVVNIGNFCCCLWHVSGGFLAAYLAQQSDPNRTITLGRGAVAGLLAGVAGAFVWLIVSSLVQLALGPALQEWSYDLMQNPDVPPALREALEDFVENGTSTAATLVSFVLQLFVGGIFATLGGLGGGAYFRRDHVPPALGGPPSPPASPPPPPPPSPPPASTDGWTP